MWLGVELKCYSLLFLIRFPNVYQKTVNFVNTDKPCRKKVKACENTFTSYVARSKKFETNNECQLCNISFQFHNIDRKYCATSVLLRLLAEKSPNYRFSRFLVRIHSKKSP